MWGGRCHGFCVPNTGMGQGGGTGQKHPFSAEVVRRRSAGSEAGQGEQKWDPWEGSLHRYRHVQGLPQGSNCGGNGSVWRREVTSVGVDM